MTSHSNENTGDVVTSETKQMQFLLLTLQSWRFFLVSVIPPMLWVIIAAPPRLFAILIAFLCGSVIFGCWRLWLDAQYLRIIESANNLQAGEALFFIWRREKLRHLTVVDRQKGAIKQLWHTMWLIAFVWGVWFVALLTSS